MWNETRGTRSSFCRKPVTVRSGDYKNTVLVGPWVVVGDHGGDGRDSRLCSLPAAAFLSRCHTPSLAFRHLPPNCRNWLRHWRGTCHLLASISKNRPCEFHAVTALRNIYKRFVYWDCGNRIVSRHVRHKHRAHLALVKNEFCLDSNDFPFYRAGVSIVSGYGYDKPCPIWREWPVWLQSYCRVSTNEKLSARKELSLESFRKPMT